MRLLAAVNNPRLLPIIEAGADEEQEEALVAWLHHVGPRTGIGDRYDREVAILLLDRMGGEGLAEIVNSWLSSGSEYAVYDAMEHAHKRPDSNARDLLARICAGDECVGSRTGSVYRAFLSLARMGAWNEVVRGLLNPAVRNPDLFAELAKERAGCPPLTGEAMERARSAAKDPSGPVGALGALGISGRVDLAPVLRKVLETAEPGSGRSRVALYGYCRLQPAEELDVDLLRAQLSVNENRDVALTGLKIQGGGEALDILAQELDSKYDDELAGFLAQKERTRGRALRILWKHVQYRSAWNPPPSVEYLGELEDLEARECLRDRAFGSINSPRSAPQGYIRALARFDPAGAFVAARRRLASASGSDRADHVRLLVDLDPRRAASVLLDLVETEGSTLVLRTVAGVLERIRGQTDVFGELGRRLHEWIDSTRPSLRSRACRFAGLLRAPEEVVALLPSLLKDRDGAVADAAWAALGHLREGEVLAELLELAAGEEDDDRRRRLVDSSLAVGNVGLEVPAPDWLQQAMAGASYLRREELARRANKEREATRKALMVSDRKAGY